MPNFVTCPICGSKTRLRTSKQDGSKFHVCINYPQCKGKVAFDEDWEDDLAEERMVEKRPRVYHERPSGGRRTSGISVAAMVCGICALVIPFTWFVLGLLAVIFGGVGISQTSKNPNLGGKGMAITGLVCGIIASAFWIVLWVWVGSFFFWVT